MDKNALFFHREEYRTLRKEIETNDRQVFQLQVYAIAGCAIFYAWLVANPTPLRKFAWFIPMIIPVLGSIRHDTNAKGTHRIAEYIRLIEGFFLRPDIKDAPPGWENYLIQHPLPQQRPSDMYSSFLNIYWLTLFFFTLVIPIVVLFAG